MKTLFHALINKYKDAKQTKLTKKEFRQLLLQAVEDGKLTTSEISELETKKTEFGLTDADVLEIIVEVYTTAFVAAKADKQVTAEEEKELETIQKYLGLSDDEITHDKKELARLRLLNEIQNGNMPAVICSNVILFKDETPYWIEPADLIEEKVLRRRYEGGSRGVSVRVMKGVSYRVGGHRGHIVNETGLVSVSSGDLVITNKRISFRGDRKSYAINLDNLLGTELFTNGIYFSENGKQSSRMMRFQQDGNYDIVGAVLSLSTVRRNTSTTASRPTTARSSGCAERRSGSSR